MTETKQQYDQLSDEAARELGHIHFEFSNLDMDIGLALVWSHEHGKVKSLTEKVSKLNFNSRVELLGNYAQEKYSLSPRVLNGYKSWIEDAHSIRELRNRFFHGRWGFIPQDNLVANVVGLPTSREQSSQHFTIGELRETRKAIRGLRSRLNTLRKETPV